MFLYPDSLSFSVQKYYFATFNNVIEWNVKKQYSIEVQDEKTGKMRRHAGLIIIYAELLIIIIIIIFIKHTSIGAHNYYM